VAYEVQTSVYEGPFDLLLHLILKQEVDLWEISLSVIIDAYLGEVERMEHLDLDVATQFLLIAATLVELKARRLLPGSDDVELDEELLRFEERDLLLARLLECKTFKDVAAALQTRLRQASRSLPRTAGPEEPFRSLAPDPLASVTPDALAAAAMRAMAPKPSPLVAVDHVAPVRASVRDAVESILAILPEARAVNFRDLVVGVDERVEIVVRFLAVLELFKQGVVDVEQAGTFADVNVRRLAEGETALDQVSLDDWDDEPAAGVEPTPAVAATPVDVDVVALDVAAVDLGEEEAVEAREGHVRDGVRNGDRVSSR
jgi:segregation and condensation protein A